jgi:hypothetical protein
MLKPERIWAVGDKTFPTYEEARTYIASRRGELSREMLIDTIQDAWLNEDRGRDRVLEAMADAVLKKFKLTLRK